MPRLDDLVRDAIDGLVESVPIDPVLAEVAARRTAGVEPDGPRASSSAQPPSPSVPSPSRRWRETTPRHS